MEVPTKQLTGSGLLHAAGEFVRILDNDTAIGTGEFIEEIRIPVHCDAIKEIVGP